jgi:hypothetical protein
MPMIQQNTDSIIEENEPINSVSVQKGLNSFNFKVRKIQCDLNLLVTSVNGKPINNALISFDSAGLTAVSDEHGRVTMKALPAGRFALDVISCGFIAKTMLVSIDRSGSQELCVLLTSNIG